MTAVEPDQVTVRCVLMRGGTSKGLYLHDGDLPRPGPARDAVLCRLMGSPDVLQIDGLGGSRPITSKVAIVGRSERADADVDYTFAQVDITRELVDVSGNCGNISSGVGPFAIDEGLVAAGDGVTAVRIHNTNTGAIITALVPVRGGQAQVEGPFAIPGVPGTGAEIVLDWSATVGARTGRLLPTGRATDDVRLDSGATIRATICDAANPCVWVAAGDVGASGGEPADTFTDDAVLAVAREIRGRAAVLLGFCDEWRAADRHSPALPMLGLVSPPADHRTLSGQPVRAAEMDLQLRLLFMGRLHESVAGTAAICLAAASHIPGSVVAGVAAPRRPGTLVIGHPSGVTPVRVECRGDGPEPEFDVLGLSRTTRRLMSGLAHLPRDILGNRAEAVGAATPPARHDEIVRETTAIF